MESRYLSLLAVFCMCVFIHVQAGKLKFQYKEEARKYCGRQLADTLQYLCNGAYNSMYKKSDNEPDYVYQSDQEDQTGLIDFGQPQFPFRSRMNAASLYPKILRRTYRGITDECCSKPCSKEELKTYCAGK